MKLDKEEKGIQKKAMGKGIPYQNLINSYLRDCVVHHKKPSLKWVS